MVVVAVWGSVQSSTIITAGCGVLLHHHNNNLYTTTETGHATIRYSSFYREGHHSI